MCFKTFFFFFFFRVYVGRRLGKCKVEAKGIFCGAQVTRGPDWDWGNQDGGEGSVGQVLDVRGWETESFQSVACVMWKPMSTNVYRVGHKGKVCSLCTYIVFHVSSLNYLGL